jgi:MFS transporter, AAHS family, 4-hydroxybenzoate transporter
MIDVRQEIENAPIGSYHRFLAVLIGLIVFFDGYDTFNASYVIHYVAKPWHLLAGQAGFLISSSLIGFCIGAFFQGKLSDKYGRRVTMLGALWIASIFSLLTAIAANSFVTFSVLRLLTGLGLGVLLPLGVTYMNEFAPRRLKHTFSTWGWTLGFGLGGVVASLVGVYLTPIFGWQCLYYVASLSAVLTIVCHLTMPESLQFSAMLGNTKGIASILSRLNPGHSSRYNEADAKFAFPESKEHLASISRLFSRRYGKTTIAIWIADFFVLFGIYCLTGWVPTVMMQRGESFAASFGFGALIQMTGFLGTLMCGYIADRSSAGSGVLAMFWLAGSLSVGTLVLGNTHLLNLVCVGGAGFCMLGAQGALNNFCASWYDTEVRGTAVGMMLGFGRCGGVLGPWTTGILQQFYKSSSSVFVAISLAMMIAGLTTLIARPGSTHLE